MEEYFKLFHTTFDAIKEVDGRFRVGGPAVCGGTDEVWIKAFMEYCHENRIPVDFVTRHHYTIEPPERTDIRSCSRQRMALPICTQPAKSLTAIRSIGDWRFMLQSIILPIFPTHRFMTPIRTRHFWHSSFPDWERIMNPIPIGLLEMCSRSRAFPLHPSMAALDWWQMAAFPKRPSGLLLFSRS